VWFCISYFDIIVMAQFKKRSKYSLKEKEELLQLMKKYKEKIESEEKEYLMKNGSALLPRKERKGSYREAYEITTVT